MSKFNISARRGLARVARGSSLATAGRNAVAVALLAAGSISPALADDFVNPGFETGDTTGWVASGGFWGGTWPVPESDYAGAPNLLTISTAGTFDAITGAPTVFAGNYAAKLNNSSGGNDITALTQSVANYNGSKVYFAWNAVLEPSHDLTDSPSFIIKIIDETTNTTALNISYSAYSASNSTLFRSVNGFVTADWKVEDVDVVAGHNYKMVFVAIDCAYGGHGGYVYVDGFGNIIPTANANVTFNPLTDLTQGSTFLIPIGGSIPDIDTVLASYTTTQLAANQVNPNFVGGTLLVDSAGPITNAFTVQTLGGTIDTNGNDVEFNGQFTGDGGLAKIGLGTLRLSAINTIGGNFDVNAGTVNVAGALSALAVNVNSGGTLSGNGPVIANINVNAGGTLAPGDQIGKMSVIGNVTMAPTAKLVTDIDGRVYSASGGAGSYDRLALSGGTSVFNAGGVISPVLRGIAAPATNTFVPVLGDFFTVVTADSVTGQFASVLQPTLGMPANRRFDVLYNPANVQLVFTPANFATLGRTDGWRLNAINAAAGLDVVRPAAGVRAGALQSLFNGLYGFNSAQLGAAFQQISGEIHAHNLQVAGGSVRDVGNSALSASLSKIGGYPIGCDTEEDAKPGNPENRSASCDTTRNRPAIWTRLNAQRMDNDSDGTATMYRNMQYGFVAGIHVINSDTTRLGLGGGYSEGEITTGIGSSSKQKGTSIFAYGSRDVGALNLSATVGYTSTEVDTKRALTLMSGTTTSTASYKINSYNAALEARYLVDLGQVAVRPVVGINYQRVDSGSFTESNAAPNIALKLADKTWETTRSKLGAELEIGAHTPLKASAFVNWQHELNSSPTATRLVSLGAANWTVSSVVTSDDTYNFGAGISAALAPNISIRADYIGERDGHAYRSDRGQVGLAIAF